MTKTLLLFILSCCAFNYGGSQNIIPRFETLGVNDGLPHSSVYSIMQDKKGFMWFGTPDGLCRYDGKTLLTFKYNPKKEQELANNFVRGKMLEDKTGNIWYCNENGIYKWDVVKEITIKLKSFDKKEFHNSGFQSVYIDDKDCMWMFNPIKGVYNFNISTGVFTLYPLPYKIDYSNLLVNYTVVDQDGKIWIRLGTSSAPFFVFDPVSHTYSTELSADPPHAIFFDKHKRVLVYDDRLVYQNSDSIKETVVPKLINHKKVSFYSFDVCRDNYSRLWMTARGNGLFYYDEKKKALNEFHHDNSKIKSLPFDLTTCLFIDRNDNLWVGIDGGGVARIDLKQPKFNLFPLSEGDYPVLNDYFIKCLYQDDKGRIWFGSQTNGLNIYDPQTKQLINYHHQNNKPNSIPANMVGSIIKDDKNNMWIGSSGGISIFKESINSFTTIPIRSLPRLYPLMNNFVYKIVQLHDGDFLAATIFGIIKIIKKDNGSYSGIYFKNYGYLTSVTTDVIEMPDKTIYATLPNLGMYQFSPDGYGYKMIRMFFNGVDLRSLRIDEKNPAYLWIGSGIGLIHFNTITNDYKIWNEKSGLSNSYVYGSLQDSMGNLWISTNKGLSYFNLQKNKFQNYSYVDGLQSNEFNTQAFYKSTTGVFYFGGIKGFNWFKPGYENPVNKGPVAVITSIEINDITFQKDSAYVTDHTITVPYNKNAFNFQFAALDYTRPEANKFEFILEGVDHYPVITDNRSARYANIPPGQYTLSVKASNASGVWGEAEKIKIVILSPFWKSTWFTILFSLLLLSLVILITYRVFQQKAKSKFRLLEKQIAIDAERNRISADMHDEIGSGITRIALLSELIQTQQKSDQELKRDISRISVSARRLVQTMSEIIWALNPHNDSLESLLAYIREQSQQYFDPLEINFVISFPDEVPDIKLSNAERRNLYLVTREALSNALKHAEATTLHLKLEITKKDYCFSVSDNGSGMNKKDNTQGHNGIRNMKKRMEDIGGTIKWQPMQQGTLVEYCLPIES